MHESCPPEDEIDASQHLVVDLPSLCFIVFVVCIK